MLWKTCKKYIKYYGALSTSWCRLHFSSLIYFWDIQFFCKCFKNDYFPHTSVLKGGATVFTRNWLTAQMISMIWTQIFIKTDFFFTISSGPADYWSFYSSLPYSTSKPKLTRTSTQRCKRMLHLIRYK